MSLRDLTERMRTVWTDIRTGKIQILTLRNVIAFGAVAAMVAIAVFSWPVAKKQGHHVAPDSPRSQKTATPSPAADVKGKSGSGPMTSPPTANSPARVGTSRTGQETVEADVSTRSVAITSNFSGTEIVIFGAVEDSRQETAEAGIYDVVVVVEGAHAPLVVRRKSHVGGLWINTESLEFSSVPSYYAIASTRPTEEIADQSVLREQQIGFDHAPMRIMSNAQDLNEKQVAAFREAIVRIKKDDGLFLKKSYGVAFIGKALFRTTIDLPANVPVGPLLTKVYLFRDGDLLANYEAHVTLQREGVEEFLHSFAFERPLLYGLFSVLLAVIAGLTASAFFRRKPAH